MKIFKDITDSSNGILLISIKKLSNGMFAIGLMTGLSIVLALVAYKDNNFEDTIMMCSIAIFFLFLFIFFNTFVSKRLMPEIEKRLNNEKQI